MRSRARRTPDDDQKAFIARGLASLASSEQTGEFYTHDNILADLDAIINDAERKRCKKPPEDSTSS